MTQRQSHLAAMNRFSMIIGLFVAVLGLAVLVGWIFEISFLRGLLPGLINTKVNAALCFFAAGLALWLTGISTRWSRFLVVTLSAAVVLIASLTLTEHVFAVDLGIDQLIIEDAPSRTSSQSVPGLMSRSAALSFFLIGLALLALQTSRLGRLFARAHLLVIIPLFISSVVFVGFAYDVTSLTRAGPYTMLSAHAALSFFLLSLGILAANPQNGIAKILISDSAGGYILRRLLPVLPLISVAVTYLQLPGPEALFHDITFGYPLSLVANITVSILIVTFIAFKLHSVDAKREVAEAGLVALNEELELRVKQRTQELEDSLADVKQLSGMLPICAWCKKVRDDEDYWHSVEHYLTKKTDVVLTHGVCPDCVLAFKKRPKA